MNEFLNDEESDSETKLTCPSLLGSIVRQLREHHNMSMGELARMANVDTSVISRIESGKTRTLHPPNIEAIAKALNVKPSYLQSLAYNIPPAFPDEVLNKYQQVSQTPIRPASKRQAHLMLIDLKYDENDQRIKEQADVLIRKLEKSA